MTGLLLELSNSGFDMLGALGGLPEGKLLGEDQGDVIARCTDLNALT